jgi:copper homeostasis protein
VTLVEICVDDVAGAVAAEAGGADRVELCAGLAEGGTTPSIGTVETVLGSVRRIGVQVLVRPRGGDFVHDRDELAVMRADVRALRRLGSPVGFVFGVLTPDGAVDVPAVRTLLDECGDAPVTFHRAFDATRDLTEALEVLAGLGVARVLTSGGRATAADGAAVLADLVRRAGDRVAVMAGGSVRPDSVAGLVARTGVPEVHLRAPAQTPSRSRYRNPHLPYDAGTRTTTSVETVRAMAAALQHPSGQESQSGASWSSESGAPAGRT